MMLFIEYHDNLTTNVTPLHCHSQWSLPSCVTTDMLVKRYSKERVCKPWATCPITWNYIVCLSCADCPVPCIHSDNSLGWMSRHMAFGASFHLASPTIPIQFLLWMYFAYLDGSCIISWFDIPLPTFSLWKRFIWECWQIHNNYNQGVQCASAKPIACSSI